MNTDQPEREPSKTPQRGVEKSVLIAAALIAAILVGLWIGRSMQKPPERTESVAEVRKTPNVVVAVKDLSRLETAEYHVERVIDLRDTQKRLFGLVEAEDSLLLVASGVVTAGVDLSKLKDSDVVADPKTGRATLKLPKPEVFSSRLNQDRTYVHSRSTDLLAARKEKLETDARRHAQRSIEKAAKEQGILNRAEKNAKHTVTSLVRSLGYDQVDVSFH